MEGRGVAARIYSVDVEGFVGAVVELGQELVDLTVRLEAVMRDNRVLRKLLWLRHADHTEALYGDDGEMQCGRCLIDFKRESVESIQKAFAQIGIMALIKAQKAEREGG